MSNPYLDVRAEYMSHHQPGMMTWEDLVGWHLADPAAYVHKTPHFFIMGRPVIKSAGAEILDLRVRFQPGVCDTWFLAAFAGDKRAAWSALPFPLRWLCWQKMWDGESDLRFLPAARIEQLCKAHG